ncbi:MAG: Fe-S cluster assembly protein SufD [Armatimonadetes bacterium]|nr:Fe-S cluster assembly protein SufD [Armatimonadota bacterium]
MGEAAGFTREQVVALSTSRGEPDWLRQRRLEAFERWQAAPAPDPNDEDWRRTDLSHLDLTQLHLAGAPNGTDAGCDDDHEDAAGCASFVDGQLAGVRLDPEYAAQGVVLGSLQQALVDHEELVKQHFMTCVEPGEDPYTLLHAAFWTDGLFLHVPAGVQLDRPILSTLRLNREALGVLHHSLVIVGEDASLALVEEYLGGGTQPALSVPVVEVICGQGARLQVTEIQTWDRGVNEVAHRRVQLGRDANVELTVSSLGGKITKTHVGAVMAGPGAACKLYGFYFPERGQQFDYTTLQDHRVGNCTSDLLFKGALYDRARSVFRGIVRVHADAQQTDAYQTNNNLLLGDEARADSMPVLEIEADDVKCSHGATLAHLNDEDLFYLKTRGLDHETAQRMVIAGFFEPILDTIPLESLRAKLHEAVASRIAEH